MSRAIGVANQHCLNTDSLHRRVLDAVEGFADLGYALGTFGAPAITSVTFRGLPFRFNLGVQTWIFKPVFSRSRLSP